MESGEWKVGEISSFISCFLLLVTAKARTPANRKMINAMACVVEPSIAEKMLNVPSQEVKPESEKVVMNSLISASGDNNVRKSIWYEL